MNGDFNPDEVAMMTDTELQEKYGPLLSLWNTQNKNADLERQLALAQQLRAGAGGKDYTTATGAALGGIGDIIREAYGGYQASQAQQGMQANTAALQDPKNMGSIMQMVGLLRKGKGDQPSATSGAGDFNPMASVYGYG